MAGALLFVAASGGAQVVPPDVSSTPIPVKPPTDTTQRDTTAVDPDSIKAPIGRFADPLLHEIGPQYQWDRNALFASGALTLGDLLDRIPQLTTYRSGWLATPQTAAFNGDFKRVRVFYDGIELDNLDPANGGLLDLSTVQLWTLEHVSVERTAGEARIHVRSWRVDDTTPYTRVDVLTGNEETNLYRGYYGKRFSRGEALQLGLQQYGVTSSRFAGSGDALSLLGRVGIGRSGWSLDAFVNRTHPNRGIQRPVPGRPAIPSYDATHTAAYVRAGFGSFGSGRWAQITAASLRFSGTGVVTTLAPGEPAVTDTVPLVVSEAQYDLSAGQTFGPARVELRDRVRSVGGASYNSTSARLDLVTPLALLTAFAESDGFRHQRSADVGLRLQPLRFVALSGSASQSAGRGDNSLPTTILFRGEAAVRLLGPWAAIGVMKAHSDLVPPPVVYDTLFQPASPGTSNGLIASIRGPIAWGMGIDAHLTRWESAGPYRPQYQSRSELNFASTFPGRFAPGNFEVRAAAAYEYRGRNTFPLETGEVAVAAAKTISALLEIRIMRAVVSYQQRNILAYQYEIIPGFEMPRVLAIYGVRWDFWN